MESAKHSWGPSRGLGDEEQGKFYVWGTGVGISNFIQVNKQTAPLTNPWEGLWGDEWEQTLSDR